MSATAGSQAWRSTCRRGERGKTPGEAGVSWPIGRPSSRVPVRRNSTASDRVGAPAPFVAASGRMASAQTRKPGPGA
jgi:hypothetical protein